MSRAQHILITGASAGIGAATAVLLGRSGHRLSLGARRRDRLSGLVEGAFCDFIDVTDEASIDRFLAAAIEANGPVDVLVNNAGLARGVERLADGDGAAWREMIETNLLSVLSLTRRVLPGMIERGSGHIVMLGSIASRHTYAGGSVYCATKRALTSITEALRSEVLGSGVRITSVDPGMVETEFSEVRFSGDKVRAAAVYADKRPLRAEDVAECIAFALDRPPHVNIDSILVMPTDQVSPTQFHLRS